MRARFDATPQTRPGARETGDAAACTANEQPPKLAAVSCDQRRILLERPIAFHPRRSIPPAPARAVLDHVAAILRRRSDLQLVRVEVHGASPDGASLEQRRREIDQAQARADAILLYLWRRGGISAERLEAVGFAGGDSNRRSKERFEVVLRIVQRKRVP